MKQVRQKIRPDLSVYPTLNDWLTALAEEYHRQMLPTSEELGGLLFGIHTHAYVWDEDKLEKVVYLEKDVIELLKTFGFPEPVWGRSIKIKDYGKET